MLGQIITYNQGENKFFIDNGPFILSLNPIPAGNPTEDCLSFE